MAPKGKSPLRKISRLGLDQLLSQIVGQAAQSPYQADPQSLPPELIPGNRPTTTTTTTTIPGTIPPSVSPGVMGGGGSSRPGQNRPLDANGDYIVAEGLPPATVPVGQRGMAGAGSSRPGQNRPLDANGDYFVPEGLPPGATPGNQAAPQAAPMPAYPPTGTTTPYASNPPVVPYQTAPYGVNAQPASAPVNGGGSATPASTPAASTYRNIGEIFAEQPPSDDPQTIFNFNRSRLDKIGRFYNLSDEELQQAQANVAGVLGMAVQKPGITPVEAQSIANQLFQAEGTRIIKANDAKAYGNNDPRMSPPPFVGTDPNAPPVMQSDENPLSVYGVYTPEQIAAIQGQIGMYTNQMQDRFSQAAGGWKPSAAMQDAYARQAQAIPAVQALEGQAALAQALAQARADNSRYEALLQARSSDGGTASGAITDEEMDAARKRATGEG